MKFTVGKKIGLGFLTIGLFLVVTFGITLSVLNGAEHTLKTSIKNNKEYTEVGQPTVDELINLKFNLSNSLKYIQHITYQETKSDAKERTNLDKILNESIPKNLSHLNELQVKWSSKKNKTNRELLNKLTKQIQQTTTKYYEKIGNVLKGFGYYDGFEVFEAKTNYELEIEPNLQLIIQDVERLLSIKNKDLALQKEQGSVSFEETNHKFTLLFWGILLAALLLLVGTIIIATFTALSITKPVQELKKFLISLGKGVIPEAHIKPSNDEIGEMAVAMNKLVDGLEQTTTFANEVGKSNFNYPYQPLSEQDTLGHALLVMKDELAESERVLEQKVVERTQEVVRQKEEIEHQSEKMEELYTDITASIRYAKRLQDSILPQQQYIKSLLPESFVLFKPKDIVSGDFYWFQDTPTKVLFSAVDCTGHGVPGAFMSLIGANALSRIVVENGVEKPSVILDELNRLSSSALNKSTGGNEVRDGMDAAICSFDKSTNKLEYAGANNPLYLIRNNEVTQIKADKFAIASFTPDSENYTNHEIQIEQGDVVYLFSDGYADQFGGERGKKFMYRKFRELLLEVKDKSPIEQKSILNSTIENWRGIHEQVDDILIIGVKF
jgi:serine phosphatase RsbU (regulator of sigma subunit)/HAMP domain-containing protein